jgi:methionyl-tRNA formyltransferase
MTTTGASTPSDTQTTANIVLLGQPCGNTSAVLAVLQDAGVNLAALILADPGSAPCENPTASDESAPLRAPSPRAATRLLEHLQPNLVIAACYPWRLSRRARATARCGVLNIHPSLLPQGRGPDPVFWVYRHGVTETGVTVHLMDEGLDTGPILAQQRVAVPAALDAVTLEEQLFAAGARLAAGLVPQVLAGTAVATPQDARAATCQPAPAFSDWIISPLLPAAWAWRFVQGVAPLHGPLVVHSQGEYVPVRRAIAWGEDGEPPADLSAGAIPVQFRPGWVVFE